MIFRRHLCVFLTLGGCWLGPAWAQENTGGAAPAAGGASSAFGSPTPNGPGTGEAAPGTGSSSAFGTKPPGPGAVPEPGAKKTGTGTGDDGRATGAASAFGDDQTRTKKPADAEPTFTIPGGYGKPAQQFTAGEGRLARPRFRYTGSVQFGYDDNVFQAPTNSGGTPDIVVTVLASPATPARSEMGIGPNGEVVTVTVPGTAATTRKVVIPGGAGQPRIGSFLTRANVGFDVQFASRKTLFTFDIKTGADVYWDRPGKDVDYTGSVALMYLRRLTPRLQFTANVGASYQTQPDLSQINTSTRQAGAFLSANSKIDLSYRFTPRVSVVTSASYNAVRYEETLQQLGDYGDTVFGTELRYLFSPRLTLLGEVRYSSISYSTNSARDSHGLFLLLGGEVKLSRRFSSTVRLGASLRTFDESGGRATSPYGELTLNYLLAKATIIRFNGRYGFEEPPDAQSKLVSLRSGLSLVQSFSPRLRGTLGVNYVRQTTTTMPLAVAPATGSLPEVSSSINTVDSTIGFEYNVNRYWTLNTNYSYSREFGTNAFRDYYRNRVFVGAEYDF